MAHVPRFLRQRQFHRRARPGSWALWLAPKKKIPLIIEADAQVKRPAEGSLPAAVQCREFGVAHRDVLMQPWLKKSFLAAVFSGLGLEASDPLGKLGMPAERLM